MWNKNLNQLIYIYKIFLTHLRNPDFNTGFDDDTLRCPKFRTFTFILCTVLCTLYFVICTNSVLCDE